MPVQNTNNWPFFCNSSRYLGEKCLFWTRPVISAAIIVVPEERPDAA
jgi:hypothetical protein